jgi:hypothetical protein
VQPGERAAAAVGESLMSPVGLMPFWCFLERAEGARGRKQGLLCFGVCVCCGCLFVEEREVCRLGEGGGGWLVSIHVSHIYTSRATAADAPLAPLVEQQHDANHSGEVSALNGPHALVTGAVPVRAHA